MTGLPFRAKITGRKSNYASCSGSFFPSAFTTSWSAYSNLPLMFRLPGGAIDFLAFLPPSREFAAFDVELIAAFDIPLIYPLLNSIFLRERVVQLRLLYILSHSLSLYFLFSISFARFPSHAYPLISYRVVDSAALAFSRSLGASCPGFASS